MYGFHYIFTLTIPFDIPNVFQTFIVFHTNLPAMKHDAVLEQGVTFKY